MTTYVFHLWQTYFVFCIYANNFGNCTHMYIMPMKCLISQSQIFYIYKPYVLFHIYDPLSIPCLAVIFVCFFWPMHINFLIQSIKFNILAVIVVLSHLWTLMDSLFGRHIYFPYLCQYLLKLYRHVYVNKILMPMKCYVDSLKYITFVSLICSFISMIPLVFHVWALYLFF